MTRLRRWGVWLAAAAAALVAGCIKELPLEPDSFGCQSGDGCSSVALGDGAAGLDAAITDAATETGEAVADQSAAETLDGAADADAADSQAAEIADAGGEVADADALVDAQDAADAKDGGPTNDADIAADAAEIAADGTGTVDAAAETADADAAASEVADGEVANSEVLNSEVLNSEVLNSEVAGSETSGETADAPPVCPATCDDGNACTGDKCVDGKCVNLPDGTTGCDDANPCTTGDACSGKTCAGKIAACPGSGPCLIGGSCNPADGTCGLANAATGTACDDGNVCTAGDGCKDGACLAGAPTACDDNNPCTLDTCANPKGCSSVAAGNTQTPCNDADACTYGDLCSADGTCTGKKLNCNDGTNCTADSCSKTSGCQFLPVAATCTDYDFCTNGDKCSDGACLPGGPTPCDDNNPCTKDTCDSIAGCKFAPNADVCDDKNPCTTGDVCSAGKCEPGKYTCACSTKLDCDDKNVCTGDDCVKGSAGKFECVYTAVSATCDDGNACTSGDKCAAAACAAGATVTCDDKLPCTDDSCNPAKGCVTTAKPQTALPCDGSVFQGACYKTFTVAQAVAWSAALDACKAWGGNLASVSGADENEAVRTSIAAVCTSHAFLGGFRLSASDPWAWTDKTVFGSYSHWGAGEPVAGSTVMRMGTSGNWSGVAGTGTELCYACKRPAPTPCDDSNVCTVNDTCKDGACTLAGAATNCDDGNACTLDSCDAVKGCLHANAAAGTECVGASCGADGLTLTPKSICNSGVCAPSAAPSSCNDNLVCTNDACDKTAGCSHSNNAVSCDDGNKCTTTDKCGNGTCAGTQKVCNDNFDCTDDSCDTANGNCVFKAKTPTTCKGTLWNGHCYEAVKSATSVDITGAANACKAKDAAYTLASITGADENELVRGLAFAACGSISAVIGGTQPSGASNAIVWSTGETGAWTNWGSGEPNGTDETVLEFFASTGTWNDIKPAQTFGCYVCEKPIGATCSDGNACTTGDTCDGTKCTGVPVECASKCQTGATCDAKIGCPTLAAATHAYATPAFCDVSCTLTCTSGTCNTAKAAYCSTGNKGCGFDNGNSDCGDCPSDKVCTSAATTACTTPIVVNPSGTTATLIPGGAFAMGCVPGDNTCANEEKPQHTVYVSAFWIDNTEVSYDAYAKCVTAGKCTAASNTSQVGTDPVRYVTWAQAGNYCKSLGATLPTDAQWEFAARYSGLGVRLAPTIYPWGNLFPPPAGAIPGNFGTVAGLDDKFSSVAPAATQVGTDVIVGTKIINMLGNVREWTQDEHYTSYNVLTTVKDPLAAGKGYPGRVVRGGSFKSNYPGTTGSPQHFFGRLSNRDYVLDGDTADDVGFRCVYKAQ